MIFTQRDVCYLPSHPKRYHSVVSLSRCQTLRQDVATRVTSQHLKAALRRKNTILLGENNCLRISLAVVLLWVVFTCSLANFTGEQTQGQHLPPVWRDCLFSKRDDTEAPSKHSIVRSARFIHLCMLHVSVVKLFCCRAKT